jgi:hypothetical protein
LPPSRPRGRVHGQVLHDLEVELLHDLEVELLHVQVLHDLAIELLHGLEVELLQVEVLGAPRLAMSLLIAVDTTASRLADSYSSTKKL